MIINRTAKSTITPLGLNHGDILNYTRHDGGCTTIELLDTDAFIIERGYKPYTAEDISTGISVYGFSCVLCINGQEVEITREVGSQKSFYEPLCIDGINLWFDAAKCIFDTSFDHGHSQGGFMVEKDFLSGFVCMPSQAARFCIQDMDTSICPEPIHMWCEMPHGKLRIEDCYEGQDCWMGPFGGAFAHCGLDINMPAGSMLHAPIDFDMQLYYKRLESGFKNNCWRGIRHWEDQSIWQLSVAHIIDPLVPEYTPLRQGTTYATTAGTAVGAHEHTHFNLHITEQGGSYYIDPWIIFWQILKDNS